MRNGSLTMARYTLSPGREDPLQALSKLERKRAQNRIAQRNYRQNQKQRMLALEAAAAQSIDTSLIRPVTQTPPKSDSTESNPTPYMATTNQLDLSPDHEHHHDSADYLFGADQFVASPPSLRHGQPALHIALKTGNGDMVKLLLQNGADVARQDSSEGNTALHVAASSGREDLVRLLLDHHTAALCNNLEMANFLGQTPLFMAVQGDSEAVAKQLLDAGADINVKDSMGNSVLHLAVERESIQIATLLLARGAHVDD